MEQNTETFEKLLAELTSTLKEKLGDDIEKGRIIAEWRAGEEYYIFRENGKPKGLWQRFLQLWQGPDYIALIAPITRFYEDDMAIIDAEINVRDERALQPIEEIFVKYQCKAKIARLYNKKST